MNSVMSTVAFVFCLLTVAIVSVAAQAPVPFQIAVVHRHGARSPLVSSSNASHLCPWYGCGVLNAEGKDMLYHLGLALREKYDATLQPSAYYDPDLFHSSSTDMPRTLQSGAAMLRGLFRNLEGTPEQVYPVLHTRPLNEDERLLVWTGWPAVVLEYAGCMPQFVDLMTEVTAMIFFNSTLQAIGAEIGLGEECSGPKDPFQCALDAQDFLTCMTAIGQDSAYPIAQQYRIQLDMVLELYNANSMWGYDNLYNKGNFQRQVGTLGYKLATHIISRAKAGTEVLQHYSGHDTTLMPLWMTLGNRSLINPVFGEAMVFAFTKDEATNEISIAAEIGWPGQLPGNHSYTFEPYWLQCMSSSGVLYNATQCPLADFELFISTRGPENPAGICYASAAMLEAESCQAWQPATTSACKAYRSSCRGACGLGFAMTSNLSCIPNW